MFDLKKFSAIALCALSLAACNRAPNTAANSDYWETVASSNANIELGMNYLQRNDVAQAKSKFMLAISTAPTNPATWYSMGYFLEATGQPSRAEPYYLKAIKVAPQAGEPENNYGTFLCRQGRYQQSIVHFTNAVAKTQYVDVAEAYENAGSCALLIPNDKLAEHYFNEALIAGGPRPVAFLELSKIFYRHGKLQQAEKMLSRYNQIAKSSPASRELHTAIREEKQSPRWAARHKASLPVVAAVSDD